MDEKQGIYDPKMRYSEELPQKTYGGVHFEDIWMSETITDLMADFIQAKLEMGSIIKADATGGFKNKYATLDAILGKCNPILAKHNLAVFQMPTYNYLITKLLHTSGQQMVFRYRMAVVHLSGAKNDHWALGSSLTYSRRYCYQSILGMASGEDDDGQAAMAADLQPKNSMDDKESAQKSTQPTPPKNALLETEPKPKPKPRKKSYTGVASILSEAEEYDFKNPPLVIEPSKPSKPGFEGFEGMNPPDPNLIDKPSATESLPSGQQEEKYLKSEYEPTHQIKLFITAINSCKDLRDLTKTKNQIRVQNFQGRDRDYLLHHFALKESELANG